MSILEKVGLIAMVFGLSLHTWHNVATALLGWALITFGAVLFLLGGMLEEYLIEKFPEIRWR